MKIKIQEACKKNGMTLAQLGVIIGRRNIYTALGLNNPPSLRMVEKIMSALDCKFEDIIELEPIPELNVTRVEKLNLYYQLQRELGLSADSPHQETNQAVAVKITRNPKVRFLPAS